MPIYPKNIDMNAKPSETIKEMARKSFFMDHIRELKEGEEIPVSLIVNGILDYLDYLDSFDREEK